MNALALWIPGTLLLLIGVVLLVLAEVTLSTALLMIGAGAARETIGTLMGVKQRRPTKR